MRERSEARVRVLDEKDRIRNCSGRVPFKDTLKTDLKQFLPT